jgi:hypothetical protein
MVELVLSIKIKLELRAYSQARVGKLIGQSFGLSEGGS